MMTFFPTLLSMSIGASFVAVVVILLRMPMKKLPKIFSYLLWSAVGFRFVVPPVLHSNWSLQSLLALMLPVKSQVGSAHLEASSISGDRAVNTLTALMDANASPMNSVDPSQVAMWVFGWIWLAGVVVLLSISVAAYLKTLKTVETATLVKDNIYETDQVQTPFVCGFLRPRIYLPVGLGEEELSYILLHEQTHIDRKDHLFKVVAHLIVIMHWFNPMAWLSFLLMSKDMEMACDERVIRLQGVDIKADYSKSLLSLAVKQSCIMKASPLAFGESHVKSRIKNILSYRNPALWVLVTALVLTVAAMISLMTTPHAKVLANQARQTYDYPALLKAHTPYVGNNSKVIALADQMIYPTGSERGPVQLHTSQRPYGVTITFFMKEKDLKAFKDTDQILMKNGVLMLSLIDNADYIEFSGVPLEVKDKSDNYEKESIYLNSIKRQGVENLLGKKLSDYSADAPKLATLLNDFQSK